LRIPSFLYASKNTLERNKCTSKQHRYVIDEEDYLLGHNGEYSVESEPTFWRNISSLSSRSKNKLSNNLASSK
jgi:hypothetical protein